MAETINYDQVTSLVQAKYMPRVKDNYFLSNALYYRLRKRQETWDGGRAMVVPLGFAPEGGGGQWWAGADRLDIRARNTITSAIYYRKNYSVPLTILRDEEDTVRGDTAIARLVNAKMKIAENTAVDGVGTALFSDGTDPKMITGLQYALTTGTFTSQTFGNIARGTASANLWWNHTQDTTAYVANGGGSSTDWPNTNSLSLSGIDKMFSAIKLASGKKPTLILSNVGAEAAFRTALMKNEWYSRPQQDSELAKAGFDNLLYRGAAWVADERSPRTSGKVEKIFYIHEPAVNLMPHVLRNMTFDAFRKPVDQKLQVGYIDFSGELVFDEMRCHGVQSVDCSAMS